MMLKATAFNCTLKPADQESSTERLLRQIMEAMKPHGVDGEIVRIVDHDVKPGVTSDEGPGDAWPALRRKVLDAEIFILGTPIWLGQPSSVCKRVRFSARPTTKAAWFPMAVSPASRWSATRMARIM
jgi:multimeric flavodoxin WrbA